MKTVLSLLLVIVSILGIADAGYITYEKYIMGITPPCGVGFDCGAVLDSPWARIGPVPLSAIGVFFYTTVFLISILHFMEIEISQVIRKFANALKLSELNPVRFISTVEALQILTTIGALFSMYLVFVMAVAIGEWCKYCLISAGTSSALFFVTLLYTAKFQKHSAFVLKAIAFWIMGNLYRGMLKPLLFLFDAETVHNGFTAVGQFLGKVPLLQKLIHAAFGFDHPLLVRKIDGITFPNPFGLAAGFDYNGQLTQILPAVGFGFHTIGTVTLRPYEGNPKPRLGRFKKSRGLLVNKGLKTLGAPTIIKNLQKVEFKIPTGISIASTNRLFESDKEQITEILACFRLFEKSGLKHAYYELNISCPNTFGGEPFTTPKRLEALLTALDALKVKRPIYVKMPIDQSEKETLELLKVIDRHQIAGVVIGNLTKDKTNPAVDPSERKLWKKAKGNLSGKPTYERSNQLIALAHRHFGNRLTIIGTGGIFSAPDAEQKQELGAELFQLISGMIFNGPQVLGEMNHYLARLAVEKQFQKEDKPERAELQKGALNYRPEYVRSRGRH